MISQSKPPVKSQAQAQPPRTKILSTEQALQAAGNGHRYQSRAICLMFFQIMLSSFILVNNVFFFPEVQFFCEHSITTPDPELVTHSNMTLSSTEYCLSYKTLLNQSDTINNYTCSLHMPMTKSITASYNLFCEREILKEWIGYYLRILCWTAGLMVFAKLQNNYSRVNLIKRGLLLLAVVAALFFFSFALAIFLALFVVCNFLAAGICLTMFVYTIEITSENLRPISISLFFMSAAAGQVILSILCGIYCNWRIIGLFYMSPLMAIIVVYMRVMVDGPRFLIVKKGFQEAKKSLEYLALMNDREIPKENEYKFEDEVKCQEMQGNLAKLLHYENQDLFMQPNKHSFLCLFRYNSLRVRSFIFLYFIWVFFMGSVLCYYMYPEYSKNIYLNHLILGFIKALGYLIGGYLILNFQRKVILKNLLFIAGIADILLVITAFSEKFGIELIILNLIAQIAFDAGFPLLIAFISEVYPTVVRHFALGFSMSYGTLIILVTKPVFHLFEIIGVPAAVILGVICLIGIGVMNKLRETFGLGLKENIAEENDALLNNEII